MRRYSVPKERLYDVDSELTEPDGWVVVVPHADVVQVVNRLTIGMYLRHHHECIGDQPLTECTCGLQRLLRELGA